MICVYRPDATDYSNNGLGSISPSLCKVRETLNGEWEVEMEHPIDAQGKWQRLVEGDILRAPVPAAATPRMSLNASGTSKEVWKVVTSGKNLRLRSGTGTNYKILGSYKNGTEVVLLSKTTSSWYEVACPDGQRGYMASSNLVYVRSEGSIEGIGKVIDPKQLRDQPFRIYRVAPSLTSIKVYARHISYDLADNMIRSYKPSKTDTGAVVAQQIGSRCESEHDFTFYSDLTTMADEVSFENTNPIDALLGEDGFVLKYKAELARDWFDVYLVNRVGKETNITIMEGKNLLGVTYDVDETDVVTRIMPTGERKNGKPLYLDELFVDSPRIGAYPHPKWYHLPVSEAKVGDDMSEAQAKAKMRAVAQAEYDRGCDMPTVTVTVDFLNAADTVEFSQYRALQNIFLGDTVSVIARRIGVAVAMRMTQYTFNCLTGKYDEIVLGVATETLEGSMISGKQLPNGEIRGSKLAPESIGAGQLQDGAVSSLKIQNAAIETAHIQTAAIGTAHIQEAAITGAKIGNAEIDTAKIKDAAITSAQIAEAAIDTANIRNAAIGSAQIADLAVTNAKIGNAAVDTAKITVGAITQALIAEGAIGTAQIADASITDAKIVELSASKISAGTIDAAEIEVINLKAENITVGTINGRQITPGTIDAGLIADGAVTETKIQLGAVAASKLNTTQHMIY